MKTRLFRRTFLLSSVAVILAILMVEVYVTSAVRESYIEDLRKNLSVEISLISERLALDRSGSGVCRHYHSGVHARVTIIANDGKVLCDSDADAEQMENHLNRPEIQQSLLTGSGSSIRYSHTLKTDLLYSAGKFRTGGKDAGFIRLALPLREVYESVNVLRWKLFTAFLSVLLFTGFLLIWQAGKIREVVIRITDFSRSLAQGNLGERLYVEESGEFGEISRNLNFMAGELETAMERNEEEAKRLSAILRNIPDALLIIGTNDLIELSNAAAKEFFGGTSLAGKPFHDVVRNPDFFNLMDEVKRSRSAGFREIRIDHPGERFLTVRIAPLFLRETELSGYIVLFHDTTQMKRLEETRRDFVANVSHEIKTPVTAIKGFSETLLDGALEDRDHARKFLETIRSHSERLNRLVDDLLTLSRIELGAIRIDKSALNVSGLLDSVLETLGPAARAKDLTLTKTLGADESVIHANRDRTIQVLLNLVDNAIKFTEKGGIETGTGRKGERLFLFVKDTGIGIPAKYVSRLGERFFRVDPSRSRALGGTGLGLAIVKHLVRAQGWEMQVRSEEGRGTEVRIFVN